MKIDIHFKTNFFGVWSPILNFTTEWNRCSWFSRYFIHPSPPPKYLPLCSKEQHQMSLSPSCSAADDTIMRNRILSTKLYFDVPPSKVTTNSITNFYFFNRLIFFCYLLFFFTIQVPLIYSDSYDISFIGIEKL